MKKTEIKVQDIKFTFQCIERNGDLLNTQVKINSVPALWIKWSDRDSFVEDIKAVLSKYQVSEELINVEHE